MDTKFKVEKNAKAFAGIILCLVLQILWFVGSRLFHYLPSLSIATLFLISRILFWGCLLSIWVYAIKVERLPLLLWPEKRYTIRTYVISIVLLLLFIFAGSIMISITLWIMGLLQRSNQLKLLLNMGLPLKLFGIFTAAVAEELIFRAYLISRLQLFFKGSWPAIILSALIFGLIHVGYGTIINVIVPLFIGLAFGWYYKQYRNIKVLIICHFILDFISLVLAHKH